MLVIALMSITNRAQKTGSHVLSVDLARNIPVHLLESFKKKKREDKSYHKCVGK